MTRTRPFAGHAGWVVGAGAELAIAPQWSTRLEYLYDDFGSINCALSLGQSVRVRLQAAYPATWSEPQARSGGDSSAVDSKGDGWPIAPENWNVHGQLTVIGQGYPSFRSPYHGQNSLTGPALSRTR